MFKLTWLYLTKIMRTDDSPEMAIRIMRHPGVKWVTDAVSNLGLEKKSKAPKSPAPNIQQEPNMTELNWSINAGSSHNLRKTRAPSLPNLIQQREEEDLLLPHSPTNSRATSRETRHSNQSPKRQRFFRLRKFLHRSLLEWRNNFDVPSEFGALSGIPPIPVFSADPVAQCMMCSCLVCFLLGLMVILFRHLVPTNYELSRYFSEKSINRRWISIVFCIFLSS